MLIDEIQWVQDNKEELLIKYYNEFIVVFNHEVVFHTDTTFEDAYYWADDKDYLGLCCITQITEPGINVIPPF